MQTYLLYVWILLSNRATLDSPISTYSRMGKSYHDQAPSKLANELRYFTFTIAHYPKESSIHTSLSLKQV